MSPPGETPRLHEVAERFELRRPAVAQLARLLDLLAADPLAPTTVTDPAAAIDVHVADSLVALDLPEVRGAGRVADVGAGAGFPGLPLAVALPSAEVGLVESVRRKGAFLLRAVETMGLANARVEVERAEAWRAGMGAHDLVVVRAVAPLAVLAEYAAPLLCVGGALVAWKGRRDGSEEEAGRCAADVLGLRADRVVPVEPWSGAEARHLHVYLKVRPTPDRFPRRPGMARKRPLCGES